MHPFHGEGAQLSHCRLVRKKSNFRFSSPGEERKAIIQLAGEREMTVAMTASTTMGIPQVKTAAQRAFWMVTLLVSGTCIGGGMLALPVQTAQAGLVLSLIGLFVCWAFMTYTGLLLVEATLWVKNETHFSSLSRILVGNKTKVLALLVYLFMNYSSLVAYTAGGAALIVHHLQVHLGLVISYEMGCLLFTLMFGSLIYLGASLVGKLNFWFMIGLVVSYAGLIAITASQMDSYYLSAQMPWSQGASIFSIILATFSYQMIVPSLCLQLEYDPLLCKKAVSLGTTIPLVVYALWLLLIHGVVPIEGDDGLLAALARGASVTEPLRAQFHHWSFALLADAFGFFAIVTSYLGLSLALFFFLKDGFVELNISMGRHAIILSSILPTLLLAMTFPDALVRCLDLSGGYGDTILSGLIPIAMVWMGRYRKGLESSFVVAGGRPALVVAALFYLVILGLQLG